MIRQLTAIMFADMVGYTALVQEDEAKARELRARNRSVMVERVEKHGGKILQWYGDGALSVFQSAIQAVESGIQIQEELRTPPEVPIRIGIHTGDIIHDDEGVFGDGVNLAARVQDMAPPGGILISEKVFDEVKNQRAIQTRGLGAFALKNVRRPMELWAVANPGLVIPDPTLMPSRPSECRNSIAVLPFMNMSPDPENEFFSDGVTEELIDALTRINGLRVTARTSSFAFKGKHLDVRKIGEELGVASVLEGSVRRVGSRVRITAQLIDTRDGYHLFSKSYDRELVDIFETQDELARTIVEELQEKLPGGGTSEKGHGSMESSEEGGRDRLREPVPTRGHKNTPHIHNTEAYTEHLKGIHAIRDWTPEGARRAVLHFQKSIEKDPECSLPYAGIATAFTFLAATGQTRPDMAYAWAKEAAQKALDLGEATGEAHASMATILFVHDWDFQEGYRHIQKAISLSPGSANIRRMFGMFLHAMGDLEGAEEELQLATQLDPLSSALRVSLSEILLNLRRFQEAEGHLRQVIELEPDFRTAWETLGWCLALQGRLEEALEAVEEVNRRTGDPFKVIPHRMYVLSLMGRMEEAGQLFTLLEERRNREPEISMEVDFAFAHLALGDEEAALDCLEAAVEKRLGFVLFLGSHVGWDRFRLHPRFQALVEKVGVNMVRTGRGT